MFKKYLKTYYTIPYRLLSGYAFPARSLNITATLRCNLNCKMCLQRQHLRTFNEMGIPELSLEEIKKIISSNLPFITKIGFCGGEIFTRKDIMDILAFASKRNPVHFATNGTLITADMAQEFVNLNIRSILISLDGTKHFHDDIRGKSNVFERTLQAIEYIVKFKNDKKRSFPNIVINSVVTEHNLESLPELLKIISRFGIKDLGIQMVDLCQYRYAPMDSFSEVFSVPPKLNASQFGNIKEGLIKLYETSYKIGINIQTKPSVTISEFADYYSNRMDLVPYYCIQPWSQAIISPYGDVYPCYILRMGNVRQEKFLKIWNGKRYREFRNLLKKHVLFPQCLGCCFMIRKQSLSRINRILY